MRRFLTRNLVSDVAQTKFASSTTLVVFGTGSWWIWISPSAVLVAPSSSSSSSTSSSSATPSTSPSTPALLTPSDEQRLATTAVDAGRLRRPRRDAGRAAQVWQFSLGRRRGSGSVAEGQRSVDVTRSGVLLLSADGAPVPGRVITARHRFIAPRSGEPLATGVSSPRLSRPEARF